MTSQNGKFSARVDLQCRIK
ncbi:hypothetical protein P5673_005807, partial [Acropora cervicornis]